MSAWRIGREAAAPTEETKGVGDKNFLDNIVKYIPGDSIVGYTTAITLFTLQGGTSSPKLWLALVFLAVTAALVILGWMATPGPKSFGGVVPDLILAIVAFVVWSLSVPGNGWNEISFVGSNPAIAAVLGVVAGILLPAIAKAVGRG